jgi:protein-S-isoprenylcysteine O-methyltransferase Ste14
MTFDQCIKIILPIYFAIYFGIAFVLKVFSIARKIGKSPLVLPKDDTAYGLVGRYFKFMLVAIFLYVMGYAILPDKYIQGFIFVHISNKATAIIGLSVLAIALLWTAKAQGDMKNSWRIGIDSNTKTDLITTGLFKVSRNPVFLGMIMVLTGLLLITPDAFTLLFLILGFVLIQVQIRLEEEHLSKMNGEAYSLYCRNTRRFI